MTPRPFHHTGQVLGKSVGVTDVADHIGLLEPIGFGDPGQIKQTQVSRALADMAGAELLRAA